MPWTPGFPRLRATKLSPLIWLVTVFSSSLVGTGFGKSPAANWIQVLLGALLILTFAQLLFAYNYLLLFDRPSLSSEEHEQAMAKINHGITGDDAEGFGKVKSEALVPSSPPTPKRK